MLQPDAIQSYVTCYHLYLCIQTAHAIPSGDVWHFMVLCCVSVCRAASGFSVHETRHDPREDPPPLPLPRCCTRERGHVGTRRPTGLQAPRSMRAHPPGSRQGGCRERHQGGLWASWLTGLACSCRRVIPGRGSGMAGTWASFRS